MKRYLIIAGAVIIGGLVAFFGIAVGLFSEGIDDLRRDAEERMTAVAASVPRVLERLGSEDDGVDTPMDAGEWLRDLGRAGGFERIVVADLFGIVFWSGHELIERGDDIRPLLLEEELYREAAVAGEQRFTGRHRIEGAFFKSLYYPTAIDGEEYVVVVEADQSYFGVAAQFRDRTLLFGAVFAVILITMGGVLLVLSRRVRRAMEAVRANERLAFLGRAGAELAHELKNPLAVIKSSCDVLRRKFDPHRTERAFGFLSEEVMRMSSLIDDILGFSRGRPLAREPFELRSATLHALSWLEEHHPGVEVELVVPAGLHLVGDKGAWGQVAGNLVRNAVAAMEGRGRVEVRVAIAGSTCLVAVTDTGPGVPAGIAGDLFDPFVSGSRTGTGLGLAIVKSLCERSGWSIALTSNAPRPTEFTITVPEGLWEKSLS